MVWAEESAEHGVLWPLVEALRTIPCLADGNDRNAVIRMMAEELREHLPVAEHKQATMHLYSLAEVCSQRPDGLLVLVRVLDRVEQGSKPMTRLRQVVKDMTLLDLLPAEQRKRLFGLLDGVVVPDIADIYRVVAGPAAPGLPQQTTYREVFRALETLNAGPDGIPKPLTFVEHIAVHVRRELAIELRRWADHQADRMGLTAELKAVRQDLLDSQAPLSPPPSSEAYLVLQLQREGSTGDRYRLSHWRQLDLSSGWSPMRGRDLVDSIDLMKYHVASLIEQMEDDWSRYGPDIHIEFVLSGEILNLDVDQWPWETDNPSTPEPMGCRYPVAVRSLDRMGKRKWHRSWHARWQELLTQLGKGSIDRESSCWSRSGDQDGLRSLTSAFARKPKLVSLVLSSPPRPETAGRDEVMVGLRAGVPLMLWHREDCASANFAAAVEELLHDCDDPHPLLERVRLARAIAFEDGPLGGHFGGNVTILWDDPARVVVPLHPTPPEGMSVA